MISAKHNFNNIDYDNLTYDDIVKFKINLIDTLSVIESWHQHQQYTYNSLLSNFTNITNGAFGYINNPYASVVESINNMQTQLNYIKNNISEYWLLENIKFKNKKGTFNNNLILGTSYGTPESQKKKWFKIIQDFDNAIELYNKAEKDKFNIFKKYLGFISTQHKRKGKYYRCRDNMFYVITPNHTNKTLLYKVYSYTDDGWDVYKKVGKVGKVGNADFEDIWKAEFPELYI